MPDIGEGLFGGLVIQCAFGHQLAPGTGRDLEKSSSRFFFRRWVFVSDDQRCQTCRARLEAHIGLCFGTPPIQSATIADGFPQLLKQLPENAQIGNLLIRESFLAHDSNEQRLEGPLDVTCSPQNLSPRILWRWRIDRLIRVSFEVSVSPKFPDRKELAVNRVEVSRCLKVKFFSLLPQIPTIC
jgi:hypothetical protein